MKRICVLGLMTFNFFYASAQTFSEPPEMDFVEPLEIFIGYYTTTNLIFPYAVKSVDRGSSAVLVQKAKGVENILQVKAGRKHFTPSNVSVVTADGKFYSFVVKYTVDSADLAIRVGEGRCAEFKDGLNLALIERESFAVKVQPAQRLKRIVRDDLTLFLSGLFFTEDHVWLKFNLVNESPLDFRPMRSYVFLRDHTQNKRTSIQQTEINPVYSEVSTIQHYDSGVLLIGFTSFFIPPGKRLVVQIGEGPDGRMLEMEIKPRLWRHGARL